MDVDSLKAELEEHLAKNPDEHAPHGFRDRFNCVLEQYQSDDSSIPKPVLEQELQQIRNEAEAAAKAAGTEPAGAPAPAPRAEAVERPTPPSEPVAAPAETPAAEPVGTPPSGLLRPILALILAAVVLAGAYYFFRR